MASFPTLRSGQVTMTPLTRAVEFRTQVHKFKNGSEQRVAERVARARFVLSYTNLDGYDVSTLRDFWRSTKGSFDATWDITVDGVLYEGCAFEDDAFTCSEAKAERYSLALKVVQLP